MPEEKPKKSHRLRNLSIFLILIVSFSCWALSSLGSSGSSTVSSAGSNRPSSNTTLPTSTPVRFDPIRVTGRGDDVVTIDKPDIPAIVEITHQGSSNFVVTNFDHSGERIELLVNEIGAYSGTRPIDFAQSEWTNRLEIQADGSWTVEVKPMSSAKTVLVPTSNLSGKGDSVILLAGSDPDTAVISHPGDSNFVVQAFGNSRRLLVNEIGEYEGTVIVPRDTAVLEVVADGGWQIAITGQ